MASCLKWIGIHCCIILAGLPLTGCVSFPPDNVSLTISPEELSDHVGFLAQPALKGRKPRSLGSCIARRYITSQFKAFGLQYWGRTRSFEQPFLLGTNIVGVLPGSDPILKDEYVILLAHYDHLGKDYLGACDNAAGVAALLEIAESLALSPHRLKRSICFVVPDCEERGLIGAFFFTGRPDFDSTKIAGVVNIDLLGRAGFEVLDRHLFLVGTGSYRDLRRQIQESAPDDFQVLPVGTDTVGPRGDHVAFEAMGIPALFFSCGMYQDYHKPTDTVDKLDFAKMHKSTQVIQQALTILAQTGERFRPVTPDRGDIEELESVHVLLSEILADPNALSLDINDVNTLCTAHRVVLSQLADRDSYTHKQRRLMQYRLIGSLLPIAVGLERNYWPIKVRKGKAVSPYLTFDALTIRSRKTDFLMALENRAQVIAVAQEAVAYFNQNKPSLWRKNPDFKYQSRILPDHHFAVTPSSEEGLYRLLYAPLSGSLRISPPNMTTILKKQTQAFKKLLFTGNQHRVIRKVTSKRGGKTVHIHLSGLNARPVVRTSKRCQWTDVSGTVQQLADVVMLKGYEHRESADWMEIENKILSKLTGTSNRTTYREWLDWRCREGGFQTESEWLLHSLQSDHWDVFLAALEVGEEFEEGRERIRNILLDPQQSAQKRTHLLHSLYSRNQETFRILIRLLDDNTGLVGSNHPIKTLPENHPLKPLADFRKDPPGKKHIFLGSIQKPNRPSKKEVREEISTISDLAAHRLTLLTGEDYDKDQAAWIRWLEDR